MADDTTLVPVSARRDRLRTRRRRARLGTILGLVIVLAASASAYAFTHHQDANATQDTGRTPSKRNQPAADTETTPRVATKAVIASDPPRVLTHAQPLQLWVGGDSLAGALGPALGTVAGATGVVHTQVDYMVSSGLASNGVRNWSERATQQMEKYDPEAVVFEIGTNDASIVNSHLNKDGVPEWEPTYRLEVARMMDTFRGPADHRRTVLWVGAPTMKLAWRDKGVKELNRVGQEEAAKRAPDVTYIDAYDLFALDGQYSSTIKTTNDRYERVRIGDGVHLTADGANYLAEAVFAALDAKWGITKHQDPAQPIGWDESSGSSGNGGWSGASSGSSSRHSSGSDNYTPDTPAPPVSLETTAPSIAPPTTAAPVVTTPSTSPSPGTTAASATATTTAP